MINTTAMPSLSHSAAMSAARMFADYKGLPTDDPFDSHPMLSNRDRRSRFTKHAERRTKFRERYAR